MKIATELLMSAALGLCLVLCNAAASDHESDDAAAQRHAIPNAESAAKLWSRFLADATFEPVMGAFDAVEPLQTSGVQKEACVEHHTALMDSLRVVPVSVHLHKLALDCAEATNNPEARRLHEAVATSLVEHAMRKGRGQTDTNPIPIVAAADAYAILDLIGRQTLDEEYRFDDLTAYRFLPLVVTTFNESDQKEVDLSFDFLDVWMSLLREDEARFPYFRRDLAAEVVKKFAETGDPAAQLGLVRVKLATDPEVSQIASVKGELQALIDGGNDRARITLAELCLKARQSSCMSEAIDTLLPMVERHRSEALILMATAYTHGIGVEADSDAAALLVDKAAERSGRRNALGQYALLVFATGVEEQMDRSTSMQDLGAKLLARSSPISENALSAAADAGDPWSNMMLGSLQIARGKDTGAARIEQSAHAGYPEAMFGFGVQLRTRGEHKAADEWIERAAEAGHAEAQLQIATRLMRPPQASARDKQRARKLLETAAHGNSANAAVLLSALERVAGNGAAAADWLRGCRAMAAYQCLPQLAKLYRYGTPGLERDTSIALQLLDALATDGHEQSAIDSAILRMESSDPVVATRGREAITTMAEQGSLEAQFMFALWLGDTKPEAALSWLKRCSDSGSMKCRGRLGQAYALGIGVAQDAPKARRLLTTAAARGDAFAQNELAWMLCTHADTTVRDPRVGIGWSEKSIQDNREWGRVDTLAACHAANGDFDQAKTLQKEVLTMVQSITPMSRARVAGVKARLRLYRKGKAFVDERPRS